MQISPFYQFHLTTFPVHTMQLYSVHHVQLHCTWIVVAVGGHRKCKYKWKPRLLWLPWGLKGMLLLFLPIFTSSCYLTQYPDQNNWCDPPFLWIQMQYRWEHQRLTKWKLSLQWFHSWSCWIPHHPWWWSKICIYHKRKLQNFSKMFS